MKQKADLAQHFDVFSSPSAQSVLGGKLYIKDADKQDHPTPKKPPKKLQPKQHSPTANPKATFQHSVRQKEQPASPLMELYILLQVDLQC